MHNKAIVITEYFSETLIKHMLRVNIVICKLK